MKILKRPSAGGLVGGNATSEDIISGKNAVVNGELVEGSLYIVPAGGTSKTIYGSQYGTIEEDTTNNRIDISRITYSRGAYEAMSYRVMSVPMAEFGDASASDVVSGKTFTSSAGYKVTGTASLSGGIDTSDATAVASDIVKNKTAYVNGEKIKGTVEELVYGITPPSFTLAELLESDGGKGISAIYSFPDDYLMRSGAEVSLNIKPDQLGDATPSDVRAGKTFTSSSGRLITGTGEF